MKAEANRISGSSGKWSGRKARFWLEQLKKKKTRIHQLSCQYFPQSGTQMDVFESKRGNIKRNPFTGREQAQKSVTWSLPFLRRNSTHLGGAGPAVNLFPRRFCAIRLNSWFSGPCSSLPFHSILPLNVIRLAAFSGRRRRLAGNSR